MIYEVGSVLSFTPDTTGDWRLCLYDKAGSVIGVGSGLVIGWAVVVADVHAPETYTRLEPVLVDGDGHIYTASALKETWEARNWMIFQT